MKLAVNVLLISFMAILPVAAASPETPWDSLRHLSKKHVYTVLNRDGSCLTGSFVAVTENSFVIDQGGEKPVAKAEILRISSGETPDVHTTVYSARSSWADVQALQSPPYYSMLMLVTVDARKFKGSLLGVSSDQLTLMVDGNEMRFSKEFLASVLLTGKKPAFEQSSVHLNPLDLSKKVISPMQPIPLYELNTREDNSQLECAPGSWRRAQR